MWKSRRHFFTLIAIVCLAAGPAGATDLDTYYAYPWSLGGHFEDISPYGTGTINPDSYVGFHAIFRMPLPSLPILQPFMRIGGGILDFPAYAAYSNQQYTAIAGMGYITRMSKNFETGVDLGMGYQMMYFPTGKVLDGGTPGRTDNLVAMAAGRLALDPSYNLSIAFTPTLTYRRCLQDVSDSFRTLFDGFSLGLGASVSYRFGEDPDAPKAAIRSISFGAVTFPPLYAAMQSYYAQNAFATVSIRNVEKFALTDVQVSFNQRGYMDAPTQVASIPSLAAGETVEVPLTASFSSEVFTTNGDTPLNGEITVKYLSRGRVAEQTTTASYVLYDRTSISWDDDRKEAAFITKADTALRNYATFIRQAVKERMVPGYSEPVQTGMAVFYALKELGVIYQLALTSSFAAASADPLVVDHVHLPRETLQRKAGDCSDLTALFCALMESVGFPTGFITVPGHIYPVINTKVPTASWREITPDREMAFDVDGELWIPVEITMVGASDFLSAWRKGVEEWNAREKEPKSRAVYFTAKCQETFSPVGLKEEDLGLQYGEPKRIVDGFRAIADAIVDSILDKTAAEAVDGKTATGQNALGIAAARYGRLDRASKAFSAALALNPGSLAAKVNLGNVSLHQKDYAKALKCYQEAAKALESAGRAGSTTYATVMLNASRALYEMGRFPEASAYYEKAAAIDPSLVEKYGYLKTERGSSTPGSRGAPAGTGELLYVDEREDGR